MVRVGCLLGGCHACMLYLQNGRGGEKEEDEGEERRTRRTKKEVGPRRRSKTQAGESMEQRRTGGE